MDKPNSNSSMWDLYWTDFGAATGVEPARQWRRDAILGFIKPTGVTSVLDVGCGKGELLLAVNAQSSESLLMGVDNSDGGLNNLRSLIPNCLIGKVDFDDSDAVLKFFISTKVAAFTHIVCSEVVEHLEHDCHLLQVMHDSMGQNAKLILTVPGGPITKIDRQVGHLRHYSRKSILLKMESVGFQNITLYTLGFPFFNLYKLIIWIYGDKVVDRVKLMSTQKPSRLGICVFRLFGVLFKLNFRNSRLGWQIIAIAEK